MTVLLLRDALQRLPVPSSAGRNWLEDNHLIRRMGQFKVVIWEQVEEKLATLPEDDSEGPGQSDAARIVAVAEVLPEPFQLNEVLAGLGLPQDLTHQRQIGGVLRGLGFASRTYRKPYSTERARGWFKEQK